MILFKIYSLVYYFGEMIQMCFIAIQRIEVSGRHLMVLDSISGFFVASAIQL